MARDQSELQHDQGDGGGGGGPGVATTVRLVIIGVLIALFVIFCLVNTDGVPVAYVFGTAHDIPLIVVMAVSAVVGVLVSALFQLRRRHSS